MSFTMTKRILPYLYLISVAVLILCLSGNQCSKEKDEETEVSDNIAVSNNSESEEPCDVEVEEQCDDEGDTDALKFISTQEYLSLDKEGVIVVDARDPEFYKQGHLPKAIQIEGFNFMEGLSVNNPDVQAIIRSGPELVIVYGDQPFRDSYLSMGKKLAVFLIEFGLPVKCIEYEQNPQEYEQYFIIE